MEGKKLYIKCTLSYKLTTYVDNRITKKQSELEALTIQMGQPSANIENFDGRIFGVQTEVQKLHMDREQLLKRFYDFRESLVVRILAVERQLDECLKVKDNHATFVYLDLNVVETRSYTLYVVITTSKPLKDS